MTWPRSRPGWQERRPSQEYPGDRRQRTGPPDDGCPVPWSKPKSKASKTAVPEPEVKPATRHSGCACRFRAPGLQRCSLATDQGHCENKPTTRWRPFGHQRIGLTDVRPASQEFSHGIHASRLDGSSKLADRDQRWVPERTRGPQRGTATGDHRDQQPHAGLQPGRGAFLMLNDVEWQLHPIDPRSRTEWILEGTYFRGSTG